MSYDATPWGSFILRACSRGEPRDLEEVLGMGRRCERVNDQIVSNVCGYRLLDMEWDDVDDLGVFEGIAFEPGDSLLHLTARNPHWLNREAHGIILGHFLCGTRTGRSTLC